MAEAASARRGRRIFLAAVVAGIAVSAGLLLYAALPGRAPRGVSAVARAWLDDVRAERYEAAYARLAAPYRASVGLERFRAAVSKNAYLRGMDSLRIARTDAWSDGAKISGRVGSSAGRAEIDFHFAKERVAGGNRWTIIGVVVGGNPALPAP